jgi:outer membrane biosynthesis protein TonB
MAIKKIAKNRKKLTAIFASFVLHFLLFLSLYFSFSKTNSQPPVTLEIELITLGNSGEKNERQEKVRLKKDTHEPSDHVHLAEEKMGKHSVQNLEPTFHPLPQIPEELRFEAFNSEALARFHIAANGEVLRVELIKPCANPKLNSLLLKSLKRWRFSVSNSDSTQDIRVNFLVR